MQPKKKYINWFNQSIAVLYPEDPTIIKLVHILELDYYKDLGCVGALEYFNTNKSKWKPFIDTIKIAEKYGNIYPIIDDDIGIPVEIMDDD